MPLSGAEEARTALPADGHAVVWCAWLVMYGNAAKYPTCRCSDAVHVVAKGTASVDDIVTRVVLAKLTDVSLETPNRSSQGLRGRRRSRRP